MRNDLLAELVRKLEAAQSRENDDTDDEERRLVRKSLGAVYEFLADAGVDRRLRAPLHHLYSALEDVSEGRNNSLFTLANAERRSTKKAFSASHDTMAAAAITILSEAPGWTLDKSATYVSRALGMDKKSLIHYRGNVKRKKGELRDAYHEWLRDRSRYPELSAEEHVRVMLETARSLSLNKA
ncbi:hypothetical protein [Aquibium oceanicum]|uniref:Uncharacterized protein n=1 Tax=Aquibium oceanicum TaxID=1670800 RepID=A0A1L3SXE2_9HYPH|nr:hypothetical protein [Aquibium oceanicum]APH74096.1 hypothetical protein BSQ44_24060 [Aquibium oceanicum]